MTEETSHADRVNPPTPFFAGHGVVVKVWPAGGKNPYPNTVIEQTYEDKDGKSVTNKVYIDNRALLSLALAAQDAHREVNRLFQQTRADERAR